MPNLRYSSTFFWLALAIIYMGIGLYWFINPSFTEQLTSQTIHIVIFLSVLAVLCTSIARILPQTQNPLIFAIIQLRRVPFLFWLIWLAQFFLFIMGWIVIFQPAVGIFITPIEIFYLFAVAVWLFAYWLIQLNRPTLQHMLTTLKWRINLIITIGTILFLFISIELGMRYFLVMSDNFAFSTMHQNWVRMYWNPVNSLGYRDNEPAQNSTQIPIIVMGDSLVTGYGVNSIDNTFPHQLENLLGTDYYVNIVAQPGWGTSTALGNLQQYPVKPKILILSFFINDILEGPAKDAYQIPFPGIRVNPSPEATWWVNNFYVFNFYYYRIYHYSTVSSGQKYSDWILNAYQDPAVWQAYQQELASVITWATTHDATLVALVWGNLANLQSSADATQKVQAYFLAQNIPVVYMPDILQTMPPSQLTVNAFDAHPSGYSHQQAADNLYKIILQLQN
jgi:hypothetical protein